MTDIAAPLRAQIIAQAGNRCGYCRAHQQYVYDTLHIEHIAPRARDGSNDEANLWLACGCVTALSVSKRMAETPSQAAGCASFTHVASSGGAIANGVRTAQKLSDVPCVDGRRLQPYI